MTVEPATNNSNLQKFQRLLRELFQFDCADLDFGIYRIMNHKREAIEKFITEDLPERVAADLNRGRLAEQSQAIDDLDEARQKVVAALGEGALDAGGELVAFRDTPYGQEYLGVQKAAESGRSRQAIEANVYNHLYTFFSRYFQDGDFISRRRYSRHPRYAIPYNGEEIYVHWANSDQYYIKTTEHFHNYRWTSPNRVSIHFRLDFANVEQDNVKGVKRFFVPLVTETVWDNLTRTVTIPFEYRPLTASESTQHGRRKQQENIITAASNDIPLQLQNANEAIAALTLERRRTTNDAPVSILEHHLRQYTRRNDSDYFIHKHLGSFLLSELDFYLKNEVLRLADLDAAGETAADGWFQQMRLMKSLGGAIIHLLNQIESFQKMLWEKRKFILSTDYIITVGTLEDRFYATIAANDAQWDEWHELLGIEYCERSVSFLQAHPTLPLDTRHFEASFTDRLLESIDDLHGMTDGLLVHSENWQALRLMEESYRQSVKCIYIDPPYNTAASQILYKNNYRHSSWASLLENRLSASQSYLKKDGVLGFAIDDAELKIALAILDQLFPTHEVQPIVVNHYPGSGSGRGNVSSTHEYHLMVVPENEDILVGAKRTGGIRTRNFRRSGQGENNFRWGRPNSFFSILIDPDSLEIKGMEPAVPFDERYPTGLTTEGHLRIYPFGQDGSERVWSRNRASAISLWKSGKLECTPQHTIVHHIDNVGRKILTSVWLDKKFNAEVHGTNMLADVLGHLESFPYRSRCLP